MYLGIASLPEPGSAACLEELTHLPSGWRSGSVGSEAGRSLPQAGDLGHGAVPAAEMLPAHAVTVLDRTGNPLRRQASPPGWHRSHRYRSIVQHVTPINK